MLASIEQVCELETVMRFRDPVLRKILEKLRTPGGANLSDSEWQALMATNVDVSTLDEDAVRQLLAKTENLYHSSYLWSIVNLAAYTSAKLTAKKTYHTLSIYKPWILLRWPQDMDYPMKRQARCPGRQ